MTTRQTPDAVREAAEEIVALPHGLDIGYAQDIARRILAALDSRAGDAGEIDNGYSADDAVDFVFNRLAEKLGLAEWQVVEGSEEWEGDVSATLHRLLIDAGIIDDETGVVATLATPAPAVDAVPAGEVALRHALDDAINSPKGVVPVSAEPFYNGRSGRVKPPESAHQTAYLMTGPWELDPEGKSPGIYMDDPEGGDPICLCAIKRVYHPDLLSAALSHGEGRK